MAYEDIQQRAKQRGLKNADLARALGIAPNKITKAFQGERRFQVPEMDKLRDLLELVEPDEPRLPSIPVIGQVAAGQWREAIRHPITRMNSPDPSIPPKAFALVVSGDSMDQQVEDGGTIIVDPEDKALFPGRFYVVDRGDGEVTFKRFFSDPARLVPCSSNPSHTPIIIGSDTFSIIGRVIWRASRM